MSGGSFADIQRARILDAMVSVVYERGYAGTTVSSVCTCAKVSSRTFYEAFDGREQCLLAALDEGYRQITRLVSQALLEARTVRPETDRAKIDRVEALIRAILAERAAAAPSGLAPDLPVEIPSVLRDPRAHRARSCLRYLAEHPGASNRQIADGIGIARHDQTSTLLSRLAGMGLIAKHPGAPGLPNAWTLTQHGANVALALAPKTSAESTARLAQSDGQASLHPAGSTHIRVTHRKEQAVL